MIQTKEEIETVIKQQKIAHFSTIRKILNKCSYMFTQFQEATEIQDKTEGFDAIFSFPDVKIPIRIRNFSYQKYMDVTVRSRSKYGGKTEIDKLRDGFGDYYLYSWLGDGNKRIEKFIIINLKIFRESIIENPNGRRRNDDGTEFWCYSLDQLIKSNSVVIYENMYIPNSHTLL